MKRYKDCELKCNHGQSTDVLLDVIAKVSESKGYIISRYSSMGNNDTLAVYIKEPGFPYSRLVMSSFSNHDSISILNIVPMPESGTSHIDCSIHNQILNIIP